MLILSYNDEVISGWPAAKLPLSAVHLPTVEKGSLPTIDCGQAEAGLPRVAIVATGDIHAKLILSADAGGLVLRVSP